MKNAIQQKRALSHRIAKYGAGAAGALATGFAAAPQAHAAIDYYDPVDLTIGVGNRIYFDLDDSASGTLASTNYFSGADFRIHFYYDVAPEQPIIFPIEYSAVHHATYSEFRVARLASGATIGSGQPFVPGDSYLEYENSGPWQGGGEGYLGLRLGAGPNYNYGWARVSYNDAGNQLTLLDFAIERTADTAIAAGAGAIPEPGHGLVALAAGALGLVAWRRRRRG